MDNDDLTMFLLQQETRRRGNNLTTGKTGSRFKLLAAYFQDQIDYLKSKFVKESNTANKGVFESRHKHKIKKRQTKPSKMSKFAVAANSTCTFFYQDYPDAAVSKKVKISLLKCLRLERK